MRRDLPDDLWVHLRSDVLGQLRGKRRAKDGNGDAASE